MTLQEHRELHAHIAEQRVRPGVAIIGVCGDLYLEVRDHTWRTSLHGKLESHGFWY